MSKLSSSADGGSSSAARGFRISSASAWSAQQPSADFQLPSRVCSFSLDAERVLHHDDRQKKVYRAPQQTELDRCPLDLNYAYDRYRSRENLGPERLDTMLSSLQREAERSPDAETQLRRTTVVTWRGIITKLCTALYADRDGFELNAQLLGDTVFIGEHVSAARQADIKRQKSDSRSQLFSYYGYSFESYFATTPGDDAPVSAAASGKPSFWNGDVNTNEQWCQVVRTKLGRSRLLIGGEVDCVDAKGELVELKTSMLIRNARDEERFEKKMLRFYMQSFLLGVKSVVVGFRDHRGMLSTYQEFKTLEMPRLVRGKPHAWDPKACLNCAAALLSHVERVLHSGVRRSRANEDSPAVPNVWRITWHPGQPEVQLRQLDAPTIESEVTGGDAGRFGILPQPFVDFFMKSVDRQTSRSEATDTERREDLDTPAAKRAKLDV